MVHTVIMPKLGQTVEESTILKWHKHPGDEVKKGDLLFDIETDKAVLEIESFVEGTLLKIIVNAGETVPVSSPVAFIGHPGETLPEVKPAKRTEQSVRTTAQPAAAPSTTAPVHPSDAVSPTPALPGRKAVSPRARSLARRSAINCEQILGSGPGGRVIEKDVIKYMSDRQYDRLRITPAAKALAIREGIDILDIELSGDNRRLAVEDIERAVAEKPREMSKMRQVIARRLAQSFSTIPHFYVTVSTDMTGLLDFRKQMKRENMPFSVSDFIVAACATALKEFPAVNSTTDGKSVRWHSRANIGLAVDIKDGLVVPVIRNAGAMKLPELHRKSAELVARARAGKLSPDDMSGGTFTVSNMGMLDVENFTAIINPGESAILAVSSIASVPAVVGGEIVARSMMKMTVSADHRLVDGATAARFANRIKKMLEDTNSWTSMI